MWHLRQIDDTWIGGQVRVKTGSLNETAQCAGLTESVCVCVCVCLSPRGAVEYCSGRAWSRGERPLSRSVRWAAMAAAAGHWCICWEVM